MNNEKEITLIIPHYKTKELTTLCLRLLRKHSDLNRIHTIVIDNSPGHESSEYLKSVEWIEYIAREPVPNEEGFMAHSEALNLGVKYTTTPYVLVMHTDTLMTNLDWLDFMLEKFDSDNVAGVGSWKLEDKPFYRRLAKKIEYFWQYYIWYPLIGKGDGHLEGKGDNYYYLRSHCAMYRTQILKEKTIGFAGGGEVAGKFLHKQLLDAGYQMNFIESDDLSPRIKHLNHATMILNPEISGKKTGTRKAYNNLMRQLKALDYKKVLKIEELDKY